MTDTKEAERFAGTWTLDECYSDKPSGRENLPLGKHVLGRINYDRDGHMAAQLMGDERTPFSSRDPREVTDSEYRAAFQTYTAYFGSYEINTEHNTVTHHVEGATVPNWPGMDGSQRPGFPLADAPGPVQRECVRPGRSHPLGPPATD